MSGAMCRPRVGMTVANPWRSDKEALVAIGQTVGGRKTYGLIVAREQTPQVALYTLADEVRLNNEAKTTACGLFAIALWCTSPALIRSLSQLFSLLSGAALMYTLGAPLLVLLLGRPGIRQWPASI
jgi:hypothetical protein